MPAGVAALHLLPPCYFPHCATNTVNYEIFLPGWYPFIPPPLFAVNHRSFFSGVRYSKEKKKCLARPVFQFYFVQLFTAKGMQLNLKKDDEILRTPGETKNSLVRCTKQQPERAARVCCKLTSGYRVVDWLRDDRHCEP